MFPRQKKCCFVPNCTNTSKTTPNKIFVTVPTVYSRKKLWFNAVGRDLTKSKTVFFCCEDHFNFEIDMEHYMQYEFMGGKIILKPEVVPHLFNFKIVNKKSTATSCNAEIYMPSSNEDRTADFGNTEHPFLLSRAYTSSIPICTMERGINVKPTYRSKYISCNINRCNKVTLPIKVTASRDMDTSLPKKKSKKLS